MGILANIGLIVLSLLAVIFLLIGILSAVRGTPVSRVRPFGEGSAPGVSDPLFRETIELLTRTSLNHGHHVDVLTNGDGTYPRLWEDLRAAQRFITMQMYYCSSGVVADTLQQILVERARAGVRVLFLYDAFGSSLPKRYHEDLRRAGVEVASFRPIRWHTLNRAQHRAHVRVVVIDGTVGYTGGFGIDDKWCGDGRHDRQWRETNTRFTGPAVLQLQATFTTCWAEATGDLLTGDLFVPLDPTPADGSVAAGLLHASPTVGSTPGERFFALSITGARKTLYLTNSYFVPDDDFRGMVTGAARRGVDVRILTTGKKTDVKTTWHAGRARYEELLSAGVRIYEYQPTVLHAKTFVIDGIWSSIGTMNADNRSMAFNDESNLMVLDPAIGAEMEALFMDDLHHAQEIFLPDFRRRPWTARVLELGAHVLSRIL